MDPVASITFDDSLWPLLVVRFVGAPTNQQQEAYHAGDGGIVTSPLIRLAASVFLHLKPMPTPCYCAPTLPAAADWTAERLAQAGLGVSAERVRRHFGLVVERRAG